MREHTQLGLLRLVVLFVVENQSHVKDNEMDDQNKMVLIEICGEEFSDLTVGELSREQKIRCQNLLLEELLLNLRQEKLYLSSEEKFLEFVMTTLEKKGKGGNILDVFKEVKKIAEEELHPYIDFRWYSKWNEFYNVGNFLTRPEHYDFFEVSMRIEEQFGIKLDIGETSGLEGVNETIKYLWKKL